jgi:uncharacterized protein (DUF1499 family)
VRIARRIMMALVTAMLVLALFGLALRIYMGREAEDHLTSAEKVEIAELRSPLPRSGFLACPPDYCSAAEAIASPVFEVPWERLRDYWTEVIATEKRLVTVAANPDLGRFVYVQHSPTFRFPGIITVEFVRLGADHSSIAIYTWSRYGHFDFAQNRKRVERWLVLLEKLARPPASRRARAQ